MRDSGEIGPQIDEKAVGSWDLTARGKRLTGVQTSRVARGIDADQSANGTGPEREIQVYSFETVVLVFAVAERQFTRV